MPQVTSARLLPKASRWLKILLNRKVPILLFFLLELAFLVFSYLSLQEHFPSIILFGNTCLSVFTFVLLAQSFHGFSFQTVLGDYHCPLSNFLGRLCFTFHWLIWV